STLLAMTADLTREENRTKAMAIIGMSIGFSFSLAMLIGPLLTQWMPVNSLFFIAMVLGLVGLIILYGIVPTPINVSWHRDTEPELASCLKLLFVPELAKLNVGIFILHVIFTASFVVLPISLFHFIGLETHQQWQLYLPTLLVAFVFVL